MTPRDYDYDEILRRALRAAADSIEPGAEGLERIRARLTPARPAASAWLIAGYNDLAQPALSRLQGALEQLRPALRRLRPAMDRLRPAMDRLRPAMGRLRPAMDRLDPALRMLVLASRRLEPVLSRLGSLLWTWIRTVFSWLLGWFRAAADYSAHGTSTQRRGSAPQRNAWLRIPVAVAAAIVVGVAGGYALTQVHQTISQDGALGLSGGGSGHTGKGSGSAVTNGAQPIQGPSSVGSPAPGRHRTRPSAGPNCSPSPAPSPSLSPTTSPTSTPSPSPTSTPSSTTTTSPTSTPSSTTTTSPSPTDSPSTAGATVDASASLNPPSGTLLDANSGAGGTLPTPRTSHRPTPGPCASSRSGQAPGQRIVQGPSGKSAKEKGQGLAAHNQAATEAIKAATKP